MKAAIVITFVFASLLICIGINSLYIRQVARQMITELDAIPSQNLDSEELQQHVETIDQLWQNQEPPTRR